MNNFLFIPPKRIFSNDSFRRTFFNQNRIRLKALQIVLFIVLGFASNNLFAQRDLITTQAGEKIRCRILDETPNRFIYAYLTPSGKVLRNEIFKNLVSEFKYNHFSSDIVVQGKKMPKGLGDAQAENSASASKTESNKTETRKASKKDKEVADKINRGEDLKKDEEEEKTTSRKEEKKSASKKEDEVASKKQDQTEERTQASKKTSSPRDMSGGSTTENRSSGSSEKTTSTEEKTTKSNSSSSKKTESIKNEEESTKEEVKGKAPLATQPEANDYANHMKFRIGARAGFGQLLKKVAESELDAFGLYEEKLNRGFSWGADAAYFFGDSFGMGLMFNNFQTNNTSKENIDYVNVFTDKKENDVVSNKRSTKFVGPVFYLRKNIDYKTMVVLGLAPGAYFYNDKVSYGGYNNKINGMDYGAAATLGIDFLLGNDIIGRDIILSLEAGYSYGKMRALNYNDGNGAKVLASPMDLSRVDLTIGLRFTRYPKYFRLTSY